MRNVLRYDGELFSRQFRSIGGWRIDGTRQMAGANKTKTRTPKRRSRKDNARATTDAKRKSPRRRRSTAKNKAVKPPPEPAAEADDAGGDEAPPSSRRHGPTTPAPITN